MTGPTRVILLGCGSYNPITNMHLRMFEIARDSLHRTGRYKVIGGVISPVNDGYNKKDLVTAKHRCAMVRAALRTSDWIKVNTWECEQEKWQRTAVVVNYLRKNLESLYQMFLEDSCDNASPSKRRRPNKRRSKGEDRSNSPLNIHQVMNLNDPNNPIQVKLLCGADMLESFGVPGLWTDEDIESILSGGIVCITRSGTNPEQFIYESDLLTKYENNIHIVREWIHNEISATKIRRSLRRNESVKYLLQDSVIQYINDHNLYTSQEKDDDNKIMDYLTPSRRESLDTRLSVTPPYCYDEPYWPPPLTDLDQYNVSLVPIRDQTSYLVTKYTQTAHPKRCTSPAPKPASKQTSKVKHSSPRPTSPKKAEITVPNLLTDSPNRRTNRTVYFSPSVEDEPSSNEDSRILAEDSRFLVGDCRTLDTHSANTSGYQTSSSSETSPDRNEFTSPSRKQVTDINSVVKRIRRVTIAPETCL